MNSLFFFYTQVSREDSLLGEGKSISTVAPINHGDDVRPLECHQTNPRNVHGSTSAFQHPKSSLIVRISCSWNLNPDSLDSLLLLYHHTMLILYELFMMLIKHAVLPPPTKKKKILMMKGKLLTVKLNVKVLGLGAGGPWSAARFADYNQPPSVAGRSADKSLHRKKKLVNLSPCPRLIPQHLSSLLTLRRLPSL